MCNQVDILETGENFFPPSTLHAPPSFCNSSALSSSRGLAGGGGGLSAARQTDFAGVHAFGNEIKLYGWDVTESTICHQNLIIAYISSFAPIHLTPIAGPLATKMSAVTCGMMKNAPCPPRAAAIYGWAGHLARYNKGDYFGGTTVSPPPPHSNPLPLSPLYPHRPPSVIVCFHCSVRVIDCD